ncbi:MAG: acyl-CoA dehydrogenase family protein [Erythrobacter sp.]
MDFRDTPEQAAFRAEAAAWLDEALRGFAHASGGKAREEQSIAWQARLHRDGWAGIAWPEAYGGRGLGHVHDAIFNEEAVKRDAPMPINVIGVNLVGPTIMVHGTDEQKKRYLPRILSGEEVWCQGFSEPGAGSDLAGLATRAERHGDDWLVNGRKIWTSWAHRAQKCILLTRTDPAAPKHKGITCLLADTRDFEIRPIIMINGDSEFNEMTIENVRVPDAERLGEINAGWPVATTVLTFERSGAALMLQVMAQQVLDRLIGAIRQSGRSDDPLLCAQLGKLASEVESLRVSGIRIMSALAAHREPGAESSAVKLIWARVIQDITRLAIQEGLAGSLDDLGTSGSWWTDRYLRARAHSIEGGTDEVQKSIIAERVLGLPRSR